MYEFMVHNMFVHECLDPLHILSNSLADYLLSTGYLLVFQKFQKCILADTRGTLRGWIIRWSGEPEQCIDGIERLIHLILGTPAHDQCSPS